MGREAAGLHPLPEAVEGETAALRQMGYSQASSACSSQHIVSLNIWSVEADKRT